MVNIGLNPDIKSKDGTSTILVKTATLITDNDTSHTQEGVKVGLKDLITNWMPNVAIQDLNNRKFSFKKVSLQ